LGNGLMESWFYLYLSMKILSVAVDELLLILVGKSTGPYKSYDAKREPNWGLLFEVYYLCYQDKGLLCVVTVSIHVHQGLVLFPSCVPEKVGINLMLFL